MDEFQITLAMNTIRHSTVLPPETITQFIDMFITPLDTYRDTYFSWIHIDMYNSDSWSTVRSYNKLIPDLKPADKRLRNLLRLKMDVSPWDKTADNLMFYFNAPIMEDATYGRFRTIYFSKGYPKRCFEPTRERSFTNSIRETVRNSSVPNSIQRQSSFKPSPSQGYYKHSRS